MAYKVIHNPKINLLSTIFLLLAARGAADVDIQTVAVASARGAANAATQFIGAAAKGAVDAEIQTVPVVAAQGAAPSITGASGRGGGTGSEIQTVLVAAARGAAVGGPLSADANDNCPPGVGQFLSLNGRQYQKEDKIVIKTRRRRGRAQLTI
jgi:hypothetical protein